jgi:hypothetical protein
LDLAGLVDLPTLESALDSGLRDRILHIPILDNQWSNPQAGVEFGTSASW